jgi:hypothetical protein
MQFPAKKHFYAIKIRPQSYQLCGPVVPKAFNPTLKVTTKNGAIITPLSSPSEWYVGSAHLVLELPLALPTGFMIQLFPARWLPTSVQSSTNPYVGVEMEPSSFQF